MKRTLLMMAAVLFAVLPACGGGGGGDGTDDGGGTAPATGAPTIETVGGTGASGTVLDTLVVTGTNFDPGMEVFLVGSAQTQALNYALDSATKFTATLPAEIDPGDFELSVENSLGKATAPLSLLKGEPGPAGPAGAAGADGITVVHEYLCFGSGDLDTTADQSKGGTAHVFAFSDGSGFIQCESSYLSNAFGFWDYSSAVSFLPASLVSSMGYIAAVPMYVECKFFVGTATLRWSWNADPTQYQDVACAQAY
jgi:hypothetical protein